MNYDLFEQYRLAICNIIILLRLTISIRLATYAKTTCGTHYLEDIEYSGVAIQTLGKKHDSLK